MNNRDNSEIQSLGLAPVDGKSDFAIMNFFKRHQNALCYWINSKICIKFNSFWSLTIHLHCVPMICSRSRCRSRSSILDVQVEFCFCFFFENHRICRCSIWTMTNHDWHKIKHFSRQKYALHLMLTQFAI